MIGLGRRGVADPALAGIAARVLERRDPGAQEIGVEADDDVGLVEVILRHQARAVRLRVRLEHGRRRNRIVGDVPGVGESAEKVRDDGRGGRARDRRRQNPDRAAFLLDPRERRRDLHVDVGPGRALAAFGRIRQAQAVVQTKNRRLTDGARRAARERMIRIAFDLDRPAVASGDEQPAACLARAARRRIEQGPARDDAFRLLDVRNGVDFRRAARARRDRAGKREARGLQEAAPGRGEVRIAVLRLAACCRPGRSRSTTLIQ